MIRMLARFGIGTAIVEAIIHTDQVKPLDAVLGHFKITGGRIDQYIEKVSVKVSSRITRRFGKRTRMKDRTIQELTFNVDRIIEKDSEINIPFRFILHSEVPITVLATSLTNQTEVLFKSSLQLFHAFKPSNSIKLSVHPTRTISHYINALGHLGFTLIKNDVEKGTIQADGYRTYSGFYQELRFKRKLRLKIKKIRLAFINTTESTCCVIDAERLLGSNESKVLTTHNNADYSWISSILSDRL